MSTTQAPAVASHDPLESVGHARAFHGQRRLAADRPAGPLALVGLVGLLAGLVPAAATAQGTEQGRQAWDVRVSAVEAAPGGELEAQAFFPGSLVVHAGDTVRWTFAASHTVTFLAGRPGPARTVPGPGPGEATLGPVHFPAGG